MKLLLSDIQLLTKEAIEALYMPVQKFANKGSQGLGILIAGSCNMPGAALLSARAALRSGLGKVIVHAPDTVLDKVAISLPEAILSHDPHPEYFSISPEIIQHCSALAIGPGLGTAPSTANALCQLLETLPYPIIVDADALNIISEHKSWIKKLPENSILTPHVVEFDRLAGKSQNRMERLQKVYDFSKKHQVSVVLKGHFTTLTMPNGQVFMNTTGNQGMATAGSGDVLTGILLGLLTRGYPPDSAAKLGVYLHGLAGDYALMNQSHESLIASDIIENLGKGFQKIISK